VSESKNIIYVDSVAHLPLLVLVNLPYTEEEIDTMIEEGSLTGFTMSSVS